MINLILTLLVLAGPVTMLVLVVHGYMVAPGSPWERLIAAFKSSASIAWTRLNALSVAAIGALSQLAPLIGAPGIKEAIEPWLAPQYMLAYILFVLIGGEIARRRTLA